MYLDVNLLFSNKQSISKTIESEKNIEIDEEFGSSLGISPFIQIEEQFAGLTNIKIELQGSDELSPVVIDPVINPIDENSGNSESSANPENSESPVDDNWINISTSPLFTQTEINEQKIIYLSALPPKMPKYLRLKYTVSGSPTQGKITAGLVLNRQD